MMWLYRLRLAWLRARADVSGLTRKRDVPGLLELLRHKKDFHPSIADDREIENVKTYATVRSLAAASLGEIGDTSALDPLISALGDRYEVVRAAAATSLGQLADPRGIGPLLKVLQTEKEDPVRNATRDALVRIGPSAVVPLIKQILGHTEQYAGRTGTLVRIGAVAVPPLIAELLENPAAAVREQAASALAHIQDVRALPALSRALGDASHDVRSAAAVGLRSLGYSPKTDIDRVAYAAAQNEWDASAEMGTIALEPLLLALQSERDDVREGAARALGRLGDRRAVGPLTDALRPFRSARNGSTHYSPRMLGIVVDALEQIGDERAVGPLAATARDQWTARQSVAAIRVILLRSLTAVDEDALQAVAGMHNIKQAYTVEGDYIVPVGGEADVDCSDVREIAQRELSRRANR